MKNALSVYAGPKALSIIRDQGLRPEMIKIVGGAAGGPKWLVLSRLNRLIFGQWLKPRTEPVFLLGSSIGSWQFACAAQNDPEAAFERFEKEYIHQEYSCDRPPPEEVTRVSRVIMGRILGENGLREILNHPWLRLNMISARCLGLTRLEKTAPLALGLTAALTANLFSRRSLGLFFERALFYDPRDRPPFFHPAFPATRQVPLDEANFPDAVLASGSIPLAMEGIRDIPGAPAGTYRDGAIVDYHLDLDYGIRDGLVLFPHFMERIIPGWFDKALKWRKPSAANMARVVQICPSAEFTAGLPLGKIADRGDFQKFMGRDEERRDYWKAVALAGERLAGEFAELTESGRIREAVRPMEVAS